MDNKGVLGAWGLTRINGEQNNIKEPLHFIEL
jgi:hypothetical protein